MSAKKEKKRKLYSDDQLLQAVAAVKNGSTFKESSETFGVTITPIEPLSIRFDLSARYDKRLTSCRL